MVAVVTVHAGSYGGQQVKSFSYKDFKFLTILVLPLPPQNEIQLVWGGLRDGIQVEHKGFIAEYRKGFGPHLLAYSGTTSKVSLSNYYSFVSFELFCFKLGVIIHPMTCNEELMSIEEFTLTVASWVIWARWREIRRFVLEFKAS